MAHDARRFDPALLRASALERFGRAAVVGRLDALYQALTRSAAPSRLPNT
jgi:hypothetical protein